MKKRIAVLARERQAEALRMAVGLTVGQDDVRVFLMDRLPADDPVVAQSLEALAELGVPVVTNVRGASFAHADTRDIALLIAGFDVVAPY
ncbi:MAG: hypothetical protein OHK006_11350 [Thermodesulfovibrionales bacterium]